jgi:high-affinity iron transporter
MSSISRPNLRRAGYAALALGVLGLLVWQMVSAQGGTPDPTDAATHLSRGAVVLDSGLLVLREGLETILVLAAVTASLRGGNSDFRRPVASGGALAFLATIATWFIAIAVTDGVGAGCWPSRSFWS